MFLILAVERISVDAVNTFKVAPADREAFFERKMKDLKATGGGFLTREVVDEFERQVRDMDPVVNGPPVDVTRESRRTLGDPVAPKDDGKPPMKSLGATLAELHRKGVLGTTSDVPSPPAPRQLSQGHQDALKEERKRHAEDWGPGYSDVRPWPDPAIAEIQDHLDRVPLWEAVVLSLGFDPGCFRVEPSNSNLLTGSGYLRHVISGKYAVCLLHAKGKFSVSREAAIAFHNPHPGINSLTGRLKIATSHWRDPFGIKAVVPLREFAAYLVGLKPPLELPERFAALAAPKKSEAGATRQTPKGKPAQVDGVEVNLPHVTKTLDALFKVIRKHWTTYDPKNPPKQIAIASDIDDAMGWASQRDRTPSRSAQTLAAAIRPDEISEADPRVKRRRPDGTT